MSIEIIDVTLRDGGYKTNFYFSNEVIKETLTLLDQSGVDYIEVGYRNGSFKPIPNIGPAGISNREYLDFCKRLINNSKLTVILHPKNVNECDFAEMKSLGVNTLRICFPIWNFELGRASIEYAKKYDFEFFINITRVSQYNLNYLTNIIDEISQYNPRGIYLADSNGSLEPEKVSQMFFYLGNKKIVPLGFHAHDNLFVAQANAIAAIENGAQYIDTSLFGLGKGAGNLRTEAFISYLLSKGITKYDLSKVLKAAEMIKSKVNDSERDLIAKDIIMGIFDLSQDDAVNLGVFSNMNEYYNLAQEYQKHLKLEVQ